MNRASDETTELKALCDRVKRWRRHRDGGRARLPEELWNAAVEVARVEGIYATSKALRFNYYSLKDRLDLADRAALTQKKADRGTTFVDVQMSALSSLTPHESPSGGKTVVELVRPSGTRMRLDVTGTCNVDIVGLAQIFWSCQS